ncbi:hypothetical protein [Tenacibaculum sp. 190524A05c]|uniref:FEKKY domain-containing protein n=1 Tax=Tenacibaculum platacis TaxID=3137852 RepID=UPI0032B1DF6D
MNIIKLLLKLTFIIIYGVSYSQVEIIGYVKSSITGVKPISEIYIELLKSKKPLLERMTMADSLGFFRIKNLKPNKIYEIQISVSGYNNHTFKIKTNEGITKTTLTIDTDCEYSAEQAEKDWKNGRPKLLLFGSIVPTGNSQYDIKFEKSYGIEYFDFGCTPPTAECIKIYNERIFRFMDEKYGKKWRSKVRSDVEYLD